jgi:hypothetical protein
MRHVALGAGTGWLLFLSEPAPCHAQEIMLTGPLSCAPIAICSPPRRGGRMGVTAGALASLDDPSRTTVLTTGALRYFVTERLGFDVFGAARVADVMPHSARAAERRSPDYATRGQLKWSVASEIAYVLGVGRIAHEVPFDWHLSVGPMLTATERADTRVRLAGTLGSSLTFFYMPKGLTFGLDLRLMTNAPANAYAGLSLGLGFELPRQSRRVCRGFADERPCPDD